MLLIRSTLFNIAFYVNIILLMILFIPAFVFPARPGFSVVKFWARTNLWLLKVLAGIKVEFRGLENLPRGGCIIASKHQSVWETSSLIPLFRFPSYILKQELRWVPLFGWYTIKFRQIPVRRGQRSRALKAMNKQAKIELADGREILIFPEGTRKKPGSPPAYKIGVAKLYASCGMPLVPVALNSGLYWPRRSWLRHPGTVRVEILEPILPGLSAEKCIAELQSRIETASDRLIAEAANDPNPPPLATEIMAARSFN